MRLLTSAILLFSSKLILIECIAPLSTHDQLILPSWLFGGPTIHQASRALSSICAQSPTATHVTGVARHTLAFTSFYSCVLYTR
ncbi:hypothetical protein LY78DRAFT_216818 [Colletotrichum sublineola]|nr:hypothetical protein LY78DRAFT_216818 [Colletotrichum sublineola]